MAQVDFGTWEPTERARAAVAKQAARLPGGWTVRLGSQPNASRCIFVSVEGDQADYTRHFDYDRFDQVASFLESIVIHVGRRTGSQ